MSAKQDARLLLVLGSPLQSTLFLFNPPPDMSSTEARRRAAVIAGISAVAVAALFLVTPWLMQQHSGGEAFLPIIIFGFGVPYLLLPASLFRLAFGVPADDSWSGKFFRGLAAAVLFVVTSVGSCLVAGQLNR
jgi:drug/metabolite transporter (DMT)-like permease